MATNAQALSSDIDKLATDAAELRKKLSDDMQRLDHLHADYARIADGIARGTEKESAVTRSQQETAVVQARIDGNRALLAPIEARIRELEQQRSAAHVEETRQLRQKEFDELKRKGAAIAKAIPPKLARIMEEDVAQFDEVRYKLASEFADLGGDTEVRRLFSLFYDHTTRSDNAIELHHSELARRGWKVFWRYLRGRTIATGVRSGGEALPPVNLSVISMMPPDPR